MAHTMAMARAEGLYPAPAVVGMPISHVSAEAAAATATAAAAERGGHLHVWHQIALRLHKGIRASKQGQIEQQLNQVVAELQARACGAQARGRAAITQAAVVAACAS